VGLFCSTDARVSFTQALDGMGSAFGVFYSILSQILVCLFVSAYEIPSITICFRRGPWCLFLFFSFLDAQARLLIPSLPPLRPNDRMSHHFRFIAPLIPMDDEGRSPLHYYDSAIQLARQADREPTEGEFEVGIAAADKIKRMYVPNISSVFRGTYTSQFV
jgi:hypothetical protein